MKNLSYNDICTIICALRSHAEHKQNLSEILTDERTKGYLLQERDEALAIKDFFGEVADRLFDIDLGQSVRITAKWNKD